MGGRLFQKELVEKGPNVGTLFWAKGPKGPKWGPKKKNIRTKGPKGPKGVQDTKINKGQGSQRAQRGPNPNIDYFYINVILK